MAFLDRLSIAAQTRVDLAAITVLLAAASYRGGATLTAVTAPLIAAALYFVV